MKGRPEAALVLSDSEREQLQAWARRRNTSQALALRSPDGKVVQVPSDLDIHLIMDNYGTNKTLAVRRWFDRHPGFHVHFTPTSASWLNRVERWCATLTQKQIRRGTHFAQPDSSKKPFERASIFTPKIRNHSSG